MSDILYCLWNPDLNEIKFGPTDQLPSHLEGKTVGEWNAANWYQVVCEDPPTDFGIQYYDVVGMTHRLDTDVNKVIMTCQVELKTMEELIEAKINDINELRRRHLLDGFIYGGLKFDSDIPARSNINSAVSTVTASIVMAQQDPSSTPITESVPWTLYDNTSVMVTPNELVKIGIAIGRWTSTIYVSGRTHKDNILAATTPQEIIDYDYTTTLWPSNDLGGEISSQSTT